MIEVFSTNIGGEVEAAHVAGKIYSLFPGFQVHFDLEDCDKILRIDSGKTEICVEAIVRVGRDCSIFIKPLPDEVPVSCLNAKR